MISVYIKTHNITGLKYFGITSTDPFKYKGSGKYWTNHINKHGNDVHTEVVFSGEDVEEFCLKFSTDNDIVNSDDWANLVPEIGYNGSGPGELNGMYGKRGIDCPNYGSKRSSETRLRISESKKGSKNPMYGVKIPGSSDRMKNNNPMHGLMPWEHPAAKGSTVWPLLDKIYDWLLENGHKKCGGGYASCAKNFKQKPSTGWQNALKYLKCHLDVDWKTTDEYHKWKQYYGE